MPSPKPDPVLEALRTALALVNGVLLRTLPARRSRRRDATAQALGTAQQALEAAVRVWGAAETTKPPRKTTKQEKPL